MIMRRICIGHGMKMYLDRKATTAWTETVAQGLAQQASTVETFFFPQFPYLSDVQRIAGSGPLGYGGQNMGPAERGAYTGEVSPLALLQLGCRYVELGHSERRAYYRETDQVVSEKVRLALDHGLRPVICIGEDDEDLQEAQEFLRRQVPAVLAQLQPEEIPQVILAYEPRWAIGQAQSADAEYIQAAHQAIRACLAELYGTAVAADTRVIYGGSVDLKSGPVILQQPDVDGLFVGRAALDPAAFLEFVRMGEERR